MRPVAAAPDAPLATVYQPQPGRFVGDVDLHFNADRLLFSMPGANGRWQVHELPLGGRDSAAAAAEPRELTLIREPDVDNYDACYLPDGRILFTSTAPYIGVPCVYGGSHVTNLYLADQAGAIRQLTVDQEHNWCPTVLNNGRVLYLRWEYTDLPHAHSRRLFHMNPDGTSQMEYLSSNSYFPNSFFYARPIPGHPTQVVGIATGHHGNIRTGRLLIVDPARGRLEAEGVVQEIPGHGKRVEPLIRDQLADGVWPQFLHPFPLSSKYFLVSAKLTPNSLWGIYLVDVFDNLLLLKESPGFALLEPIPLQKTLTAPQHHRPGRSPTDGRGGVHGRRVPGRRAERRPARHGQAAPRLHVPFQLPRHGWTAWARSAWTGRGTSSASWARCRSRKMARPFSASRPTRRSPCNRWTPRARLSS